MEDFHVYKVERTYRAKCPKCLFENTKKFYETDLGEEFLSICFGCGSLLKFKKVSSVVEYHG
jgi:hypothetical protein